MNNATLLNTTFSGLNATKHFFAATANTTTIGSDSTYICTLSPHARALSSVLTSFVGTSLTGLSSGSTIAFQVGWVCWFASLRNAVVGVYQVYSIARLELPEGGEHFFKFLDRFCHHDFRGCNVEFFRDPRRGK
jgi:hypothetical protein